MKISPKVWFVARIWLGLLFAYAGFTKIMDPVENFQGAISQYQLIPYSLVPLLAYVLPWLEFLGGVSMLLGYAPKISAAVLGILSFGFVLVLGSSDAFLKGGQHDCGCFGELSPIKLSMQQVFIMDILDTALCLKLYSLKDFPLSLDKFLKGPRR